MDGKVPCNRCGALILPITAAETNGLCRPCSTGTREAIEAARQRNKQEREERKNPGPDRRLWLFLLDRVHKSPAGFNGLSEPERLYYAVGVLVGEVYNGGFDQYFTNSSGDHAIPAAQGLMAVGAGRSLELLRQATRTLFQGPVPADRSARIAASLASSRQTQATLSQLDQQFWSDPDRLADRMEAFARQQGLLESI